MTTRFMRLGLFGSMIFLLAVGFMYFQPPAQAQTEDEKDTSATVVTEGVAPTIECKWELADDQSGFSGSTFPDPVIQYGSNDDDPAVVPDGDNDIGNGIQVPCSGPPATLPGMNDDVRHMIQVIPNSNDDPEERWIQLWAAIDHEFGVSNIDSVFWDIYHPDDTLKIKVHGEDVARIGGENGANRSEECANLGDSSTLGTMFHAAVQTGQIAAAAVDDVNLGIVAKCQQGEKAVYFAKFQVSKEQPCGQYRIELHASSKGFATVMNNYIDVVCFLSFEVDFENVDWGDISPGNFDIVGGDLDMTTPDKPTVQNLGNHPIGIAVQFHSLIQTTDGDGLPVQLPAEIDEFDACFGKLPSTLECIGDGLEEQCDEPNGGATGSEPECVLVPQDPILADEIVEFGEEPAQVLCSNDVGKLDLSIHPRLDIPAGTYEGTVLVIARLVHTGVHFYVGTSEPGGFECPSANLGLDTDQEHIHDDQGV